jgi:ribosomal protein S6
MKKESGKYNLFDTRIESSTIDDLFNAFRNNPNIPSKKTFVNKLKTKLTAKMELKLEF